MVNLGGGGRRVAPQFRFDASHLYVAPATIPPEVAMTTTTLSVADQQVLRRAVHRLERESLVARLTQWTGEPITLLMRQLPERVSRQIHNAVQRALWKALDIALYKLDAGYIEPGLAGFKALSGVSGGLGGFLGIAALPIELPVTTTLMLRSIANIARGEGEDLRQPGSRLACLEVFALGPRCDAPHDDVASTPGLAAETSYYAARAFLAKTVREAARLAAQRGVARQSSPVIIELISAIASRFGFVVSEKFVATAIPVVGAIGGAAVNLAFMEHFQKLAQSHFAIRRLEREYGPEEIHRLYDDYALQITRA
jgi:hypothetical protein